MTEIKDPTLTSSGFQTGDKAVIERGAGPAATVEKVVLGDAAVRNTGTGPNQIVMTDADGLIDPGVLPPGIGGGVPPGGSEFEILSKVSGDDGDAEWQDPATLGLATVPEVETAQADATAAAAAAAAAQADADAAAALAATAAQYQAPLAQGEVAVKGATGLIGFPAPYMIAARDQIPLGLTNGQFAPTDLDDFYAILAAQFTPLAITASGNFVIPLTPLTTSVEVLLNANSTIIGITGGIIGQEYSLWVTQGVTGSFTLGESVSGMVTEATHSWTLAGAVGNRTLFKIYRLDVNNYLIWSTGKTWSTFETRLTPSFVTAFTNTTGAVVLSGITAGQLLLGFQSKHNAPGIPDIATGGYISTPATGGAMTLAHATDTDMAVRVCWKIAAGGETSFAQSSPVVAHQYCIVAVYNNVDPTNPVSVGAMGQGSGSVNVTGPALTLPGERLVVGAHKFHGAQTGPLRADLTSRATRSAGASEMEMGDSGALVATWAAASGVASAPVPYITAALALLGAVA